MATSVVRCRHCRRLLKDPDSRRRGVGRTCAENHGEWAPTPRMRHPDVEQDEDDALFGPEFLETPSSDGPRT